MYQHIFSGNVSVKNYFREFLLQCFIRQVLQSIINNIFSLFYFAYQFCPGNIFFFHRTKKTTAQVK